MNNNLSPSNKSDQTAGKHDVSRSDKVATPEVVETVQDVVNQHAKNGEWNGPDPYS